MKEKVDLDDAIATGFIAGFMASYATGHVLVEEKHFDWCFSDMREAVNKGRSSDVIRYLLDGEYVSPNFKEVLLKQIDQALDADQSGQK